MKSIRGEQGIVAVEGFIVGLLRQSNQGTGFHQVIGLVIGQQEIVFPLDSPEDLFGRIILILGGVLQLLPGRQRCWPDPARSSQF